MNEKLTDLELEAVHLRGRVAELERIVKAQEDELGKLRGHDGALSEREWRVLDMWPRFEDGECAWLGDGYIDTDGDENAVCGVMLDGECANLIGREGFHTGFDEGERVKRPAPERLTHREPDSWEKLFGEASVGACCYFGRVDKDGTERCEGCPAEQADCCTSTQMEDLIRRAKALAGIEVER